MGNKLSRCLQMVEILEFSNWKYSCGKFYDPFTLTNLTILSKLQRLGKLGSSHKLRICMYLESGRTGIQLFGLLLWNSTEQREESTERGAIHV